MTFLWVMVTIWLCLATLLTLYVLFKTVFRISEPGRMPPESRVANY